MKKYLREETIGYQKNIWVNLWSNRNLFIEDFYWEVLFESNVLFDIKWRLLLLLNEMQPNIEMVCLTSAHHWLKLTLKRNRTQNFKLNANKGNELGSYKSKPRFLVQQNNIYVSIRSKYFPWKQRLYNQEYIENY